MGSGRGPDGFHFARLEGVLDLPVQIVTVRHDDDARVGDRLFQGQRLAQHDHGKRLTGPGRMPDHSALTDILQIELPDPFH